MKFDKGGSVSQSIWDNSLERYQRNNFKFYWELLQEVRKYQYKYMTGDESIAFLNNDVEPDGRWLEELKRQRMYRVEF